MVVVTALQRGPTQHDARWLNSVSTSLRQIDCALHEVEPRYVVVISEKRFAESRIGYIGAV